MTTEERRRRQFTEDFKKSQVKLIEAGSLTVSEVSRLYEVRRNNVYNWVSKYGSKPPLKPIVVSDGSEINKLKELEKESLGGAAVEPMKDFSRKPKTMKLSSSDGYGDGSDSAGVTGGGYLRRSLLSASFQY